MEKWTISRQIQWPEGDPVVEISAGGIDYCNPDALTQKYPGEFEEFTDPCEAVKVAIEICRAWRRGGEKKACVGIGATGGMTMPFEPISFIDAAKWAEECWESLEKCEWCGDILPEEFYMDEFGNGKFCSESCVEHMTEYFEETSKETLEHDLQM